MQKKICLSLFFTLLLCAKINAQSNENIEKAFIKGQMENPTLPFIEITKRAQAYFNSIEEENEEEFKETYFSWEEYWSTRCYYPGCQPGGDVKGAKLKMLTTILNYTRCTGSVNGASSWVSEGPAANTNSLCNLGYVSAVAYDNGNNNIIYSGTNRSGIYKTTNGGSTWANLTDILNISGLGISNIIVSPVNANNVLAAANNGVGVIESTDGGSTWAISNITSAAGTDINANKIKFSSNSSQTAYVYATADDRVWYRTAGGASSSWVPISAPSSANFSQTFDFSCGTSTTPPSSIKTSFYDLETITINNVQRTYASTRNESDVCIPHIMEITGTSMTQIPLPPGTNPWGSIVIDATPADPGSLYAFFLDRANGCNSSLDKYVLAKYNGSQWTMISQTPTLQIPDATGGRALFE